MLHNKWYFRKTASTPVWRVAILHYVAKALGLLAHVNGIPIGSTRLYRRDPALRGEREAASA